MESTGDLSPAAQALFPSGDSYRLLAENSSDVVTLGSNDGIWLWVSPSVEHLLGWTPDELVGQPARGLFHPDDLASVAPANAALLLGEPTTFEARVRTKDGQYRWIDARLKPVFDAHGNVVGRIGGWRDVQAQHEAQEALAASERRFRMMAENASDIVFHTVDGVTEWVSPSLTAVTGWLPEDLIGGTTAHLWHPDDRDTAVALRDATYAGQVGRGELRYRRKDGSYVWMDVALQPYVEPDGRTGAVGIMRDIDDRVVAQRALAESEARYRLLAENSSDTVAVAQADGVITWMSSSVTAMLGWQPSDLVGHRAAEFLHPDDVPAVAAGQARFAAGEVVEFEARMRTADGGYRWVASRVRPILDDTGAVVTRIAGWRDVHDAHVARDALAASEEHFRLLALTTSDVAYRSGLDGVIAWCSDGVERLLGYSPQEIIGRDGLEFVHPDDVAVITTAPTEVDGVLAWPPVRMLTKDGSTRWAVITARMLSEGGELVGVMGGWRDVTDEHAATVALAESEARYRLLAENASDVVYLVGPDRLVTWISPNVEASLGWTVEEMIGASVFDLIHPEDQVRIMAVRETVYAGGQIDNPAGGYESRVRCKDGSYKWLALKTTTIADADGQMTSAVTGMHDVDALVRARQMAEDEEELLRVNMDAVQDPLVLLKAVRHSDSGGVVDFTYLDVNQATGDYLSMAPEDLIGRTLLELLPGLIGSGLFALYVAAIESDQPTSVDDFLYDNEILGVSRFYDIRATRVSGDRLSLTWRDVTDRHEAADAIAESEETLRLLLNTLVEPWVLLAAVRDDEGHVTDFRFADANPVALNVYGMAKDELVGQSLSAIHPAAKTTDLFDMYVAVVDDDKPMILDDWAYPQDIYDGEVLRYDVRAVKVGDAVSQTWRDVSERYRHQNEIAESEERFRVLADSSGDVVIRGRSDVMIWVAPALTTALGWDPDDWIGHRLEEFLNPDDYPLVQQAHEGVAEGSPVTFTVRVRAKDGDDHWVEIRSGPFTNTEGVTDGGVASLRVVDVEVAAKQSLAESELRYRVLAENSGDVVIRSRDDIMIWASQSLTAVLGWEPDDWVGHVLDDFINPDDYPVLEQTRTYGGSPDVITVRVRAKDGNDHWAELRSGPFTNAHGVIEGAVGSIRVVDAEVTARRSLAESEERYRLLAENSTDVVLQAREGIMRWLSPSLGAVLGWQPEEWTGHHFEEFTHPDDIHLAQERRAEINTGAVRVTTLRMRAKDNVYHWVEIHAGPFINAAGEQDGILATFRVVDAEMAAREELEHLARYDTLTGVLNRKEILHKLSGMSAGARRPGQQTAVLFCDIDRFKEINDTYGHAAGDEVLRTLAERINAAVRDEDYVARIGGDELLVILTAVHGLDDAIAVGDKIRDAASVSIGLEHARVTTTLSIGVTLMKAGESVDTLVERADRAMYDAKQGGRNQVVAIN